MQQATKREQAEILKYYNIYMQLDPDHFTHCCTHSVYVGRVYQVRKHLTLSRCMFCIKHKDSV